MKRTRVCELLGIEYPIIQGGMGWISNPELVAAVSNAGGLGVLSPTAGAEARGDPVVNLRRLIRKTRGLTTRPFAVNIGLEVPAHQEHVETALEEKVPVIITTAGSPAIYTKYLKQAGRTVLHPVFSVRHALRAEAEGVDMVIASGCDAGGLISRDEVTTLALVPQVVDAVKIPVVAAGGIADARGLVAMFALGAEGVQMGTRFIATHECIAHPRFKEAILKAIDTDTLISGRKSGPPSARTLKNELAARIKDMEDAGATPEEVRAFIGQARLRLAVLEGDVAQGSALCGEVAGMIKDIVSAGEVVRRLVEGYAPVVARL